MAFFGITNLGYQNPIGNKMLVNPKASDFQENDVHSKGWSKQPSLPPANAPSEPLSLKCTDTCSVYNQLSPSSWDIHHGSYERYLAMLKMAQSPSSPNQLYSMPLTESQKYGWLLHKNKPDESWTKIKRFGHRNSDMTRFVDDMAMTDREFSLF